VDPIGSNGRVGKFLIEYRDPLSLNLLIDDFHVDKIAGCLKDSSFKDGIEFQPRCFHRLIRRCEELDACSLGGFEGAGLQQASRLKLCVSRVLKFGSFHGDQRNYLDFDFVWSVDRITSMNPIFQRLMDSTEGFSEVDFVIDPFNFRSHRQGLVHQLAVRQIKSKAYFFPQVHPSHGDGDREHGALGYRCGSGQYFENIDASSRGDIRPRKQYACDRSHATLWTREHVDRAA
jgi:hypothetical protein